MGMQRRIAIIGGDMRQVYLAQMLLEEGQDVVTWGLEKEMALGLCRCTWLWRRRYWCCRCRCAGRVV